MKNTNSTAMSWPRQPPRCRNVSKAGDTIYSCRDCVMDNCCVMCEDCFQNSVHWTHTIKKRESNGGTACSCGEVEVWKRAPYCSKHAPAGSGAAARETPPTQANIRSRGIRCLVISSLSRLVEEVGSTTTHLSVGWLHSQ
ncbi:E3 ubiquitin-protein ligase UBR1-like [Engraulis encrasicolus]|uniref:E3 ubiquitin-protein ligase UBR1-like n=1 Tax=Engraulis encrasicolus TaxID=184585 RepID=UPI002FCFD868